MKKIIKINNILLLISLILTSILICNWYDETSGNELYNSNYGYNYNDSIYFSSKIDIKNEDVAKIIDLANSNSILISRDVIKIINNHRVTYHYLNYNDMYDLTKLFNISNSSNEIKYVSTYEKGHEYLHFNDFLDNDFHTFTLFEEYYENNNNYTGEYKIFFNNKNDLNNFKNKVASYFGISESELTAQSLTINLSNFEMTKNIYFAVMTIILFSIFITNLFNSFKKSNQIGVYKLNGLSNSKIIKYIMINDLNITIIISIVVFIIDNIIIKNICWEFALILFSTFLLIDVIQFLLYIISIFIIVNKIKLSNLIKKITLTNGIIKFNSFFKIVVLSALVVISALVITELSVFTNKKNDLKSFEKYSNYSVFSKFYEGNDFDSLNGETDEIDKSNLELYKYLDDLGIIYVDFKNYFSKTMEDENFYNIPTTNGNKKYKYGTIDYNYLNDLNLINTDNNEKIVIEKNYSGNIFLIPSSKKGEVESFKNYYYEYYEPRNNDLFIVYDDMDIPSLSPEIAEDNHYLISSPIMRLITPGNVSLREVNVYGSGYDTALKIKTGSANEKSEFYNSIYPKLVELKLDDNIFYTYSELFENELNTLEQQITTFSLILIFVAICYIYIIIQDNLLYLKNEYKIIAIKKLNGFSDYKVYAGKIITSFVLSLIVIVITIAFSYKHFNIHYILIIGLIALIIEMLSSCIVIKINSNKYIVNAIKGGEL